MEHSRKLSGRISISLDTYTLGVLIAFPFWSTVHFLVMLQAVVESLKTLRRKRWVRLLDASAHWGQA